MFLFQVSTEILAKKENSENSTCVFEKTGDEKLSKSFLAKHIYHFEKTTKIPYKKSNKSSIHLSQQNTS